ncbi:MAG: hypothetical protein HYS22_05820 [Deltaproteobacteria bacterium]|nr:hypothetical protein [Deltaproteobacteria bacterium]
MRNRRLQWGILGIVLIGLASLPLFFHACGSSSDDSSSTTNHTITLKGASK